MHYATYYLNCILFILMLHAHLVDNLIDCHTRYWQDYCHSNNPANDICINRHIINLFVWREFGPGEHQDNLATNLYILAIYVHYKNQVFSLFNKANFNIFNTYGYDQGCKNPVDEP